MTTTAVMELTPTTSSAGMETRSKGPWINVLILVAFLRAAVPSPSCLTLRSTTASRRFVLMNLLKVDVSQILDFLSIHSYMTTCRPQRTAWVQPSSEWSLAGNHDCQLQRHHFLSPSSHWNWANHHRRKPTAHDDRRPSAFGTRWSSGS